MEAHGQHGAPESSGTMERSTEEMHEHREMSMYHETADQVLPNPMDAIYEPYALRSIKTGPFGMLLFDQLEYRAQAGEDLFRWDADGWYGGDYNRFWFRSEGEQFLDGADSGEAEIHGYYSRLIAPFWDAQVGIRYDQEWERGDRSNRSFAAVGLEGFAPYRYEVVPTMFVSEQGDVSARITATKDYRITQRLVAQPRFETEVAAQSAPQFGVGSGFNYVELGFRLRYEIRREIAPYVGVNWERSLGKTGKLVKAEGNDRDVLSAVVGIRVWF